MHILLISTNRNNLPMPVLPSGACLVAEAAERAGHRVELLDLMFKKEPLRAVADALSRRRYGAVGLSVRNIDNNDMLGTAFYIEDLVPLVETVRSRSKAPVILGGASLTVMPEAILGAAGADFGVVGDGEAVFPELLARLERHESPAGLPGAASFAGGAARVNPAPVIRSRRCAVPDYHRWLDMKAYRSRLATVPLQSKLGCQFQCVYCTYRKIEGEAYRLFDPESVGDAAARLVRRGLTDIEFVDNVFNAPYEHAMAVCAALARSRVRARFQSVELNPFRFDDDLLAAMERAGFVGIGLTVESASEPVLRGLRKGFSLQAVHEAAGVVRRHKLPCVWIFLLGGPGETEETVRETVRFAGKEIRPADAVFFNTGIRIYPGTELESIARRQGVLSRPPEAMLSPVFYVSPGVDPVWLREEVKKAMDNHLNFMSVDSFNFPYLPRIHRIGHCLGLRSPLWRYTRHIRRGLRAVGMEA